MDIFETIKKRRSIRAFQDKPIEKDLIEKLIEAGVQAPSNCNVQGWRFIVINNQEAKNKIVDNGGSVLIKKAPAGILVVYDNRTRNIEYQDYIQSASAAMQNIFLSATALGLGCCWLNHLPSQRKLRKMFEIPNYFSPIGFLMIGYPKHDSLPVARKYHLGQIVSYNTFGKNMVAEKINSFKLHTIRMLIKTYQFIPNFIKKWFLNKFIDRNFVKKFEN